MRQPGMDGDYASRLSHDGGRQVIWTELVDSLSSPLHSPDRLRSAKPPPRGVPRRVSLSPSFPWCHRHHLARPGSLHGLSDTTDGHGGSSRHWHDRSARSLWCLATSTAGRRATADRQHAIHARYPSIRWHATLGAADAGPRNPVAKRDSKRTTKLVVVVANSARSSSVDSAVRRPTPKLGRSVPAERDGPDPAVRQPSSGSATTVRQPIPAGDGESTAAVQSAASEYGQPVPTGRQQPDPEWPATSEQRLPTDAAGRHVADAAPVPAAGVPTTTSPTGLSAVRPGCELVEPVCNERHVAPARSRDTDASAAQILTAELTPRGIWSRLTDQRLAHLRVRAFPRPGRKPSGGLARKAR